MPPEEDRIRELKTDLQNDLREIRDEFRHGVDELRSTITSLPVVRQDVYEANRQADANARVALEALVLAKAETTERRVLDLEQFNMWLIRLVVGAIVTGAIGLLFAFNR